MYGSHKGYANYTTGFFFMLGKMWKNWNSPLCVADTSVK